MKKEPTPAPVPAKPSPPTPGALIEITRIESNYTIVPNVVFDLPRTHGLDPSSQAVLNQIIRHTYGWRKGDTEKHPIGLNTLAANANVSRNTAIRALAALEAAELISRERHEDALGHRTPDTITLLLRESYPVSNSDKAAKTPSTKSGPRQPNPRSRN